MSATPAAVDVAAILAGAWVPGESLAGARLLTASADESGLIALFTLPSGDFLEVRQHNKGTGAPDENELYAVNPRNYMTPRTGRLFGEFAGNLEKGQRDGSLRTRYEGLLVAPPGAATVVLRLADGTQVTMQVVQGFAVLRYVRPTPGAATVMDFTAVALDASGRQLAVFDKAYAPPGEK